MEALDFEKIGLNKNESKVYLALIHKKEACASELVKFLGVHRNIIYDNLEKLIEKGLVSFVVKETKKYFIAEEPDSIIDFLNSEKSAIDQKIKRVKELIPDIYELLHSQPKLEESEVIVFRGVKGIKKVLTEILKSKENWAIGISNASVDVLGVTYWKNFNAKIKELKIKEHFLLNSDFKDESYFKGRKTISIRRLPKELTQVTEIILFGNQIAMFIYSENPHVIIIKDKNMFQTFRQQFEFLWKKSKK